MVDVHVQKTLFRLQWRSQPTCSWRGCRTRTRLRLAPDLQKLLIASARLSNALQCHETWSERVDQSERMASRWRRSTLAAKSTTQSTHTGGSNSPLSLLCFEKQYFITSRIFGVISLLNVSQNIVFPESLWRLSSVLGQMRRGLAITGNCSWPACSGCLLSPSPPTPSPNQHHQDPLYSKGEAPGPDVDHRLNDPCRPLGMKDNIRWQSHISKCYFLQIFSLQPFLWSSFPPPSPAWAASLDQRITNCSLLWNRLEIHRSGVDWVVVVFDIQGCDCFLIEGGHRSNMNCSQATGIFATQAWATSPNLQKTWWSVRRWISLTVVIMMAMVAIAFL